MPNASTLATMTGAKSKNSRGRTSGPDRGGIRKKGGPQRLDRDGDLEMDGSKGIGRGGRIRGRSDATRRMQTGPGRETTRHGEKDKTLNALQKAIFSNASSQINIRQGRSPQADGAPKDRKAVGQLRVRGWRNSKAASNPDGGIESLVSFLEKKSSPPVRISKVCATSPSGGHRRIRSMMLLACSRTRSIFQNDDSNFFKLVANPAG